MSKISNYILIFVSVIVFVIGLNFSAQAAEKCTIQSTKFNPSGTQATSWYKGNNPPQIRIDVSTKNCIGKSLEISITEKDYLGPDDDVTEIENRKISTTSDNFSLNYKTGESECETRISGRLPECEYYVSITNISDGGADYSSEGKNELGYDCEGTCDMLGNNWNWLGNTTPLGTPTTTTNTTTSTTIYKPLAPLPNLTEPIDTASPNALGNYLNVIIKLVIGISAVLAVLMIIMGGLEYITSELPGAKGEGKKRITDAVVGLLIAMGAWIILYTINPKILNTVLDIDPTTIQFVEGPEIDGDPGVICGKTNRQGIVSCDSANLVNIVFLGKGVTVHKSIVADLQIIDTAWKNSTNPAIRNYRINSVGGFNPRSATGTSTTPSAHAFGLAIDINPSANPYVNSSSPCTTDMPLAFVQLFTSRGFGWGGYWKTKKDAMHFSRASNEAGYTSGTCSGLK